MKTNVTSCSTLRLPGGQFLAALFVALLVSPLSLVAPTAPGGTVLGDRAAIKATPIPAGLFGPVAGKPCQGEGLSVTATPGGARVHCWCQRLEGEVTSGGLWLTSTSKSATGQQFRVVAVAVGRGDAARLAAIGSPSGCPLPNSGQVVFADQVARLIRPGFTEEYSASVDGVRQDFVIDQRPAGEGELRVELDVSGAKAEPLANGARLVVEGSGRKLAYNRLRVVDATGCELAARLEIVAANRLAVHVADAGAAYPVRIDPTFSDADWVGLNTGMPGADGNVYAMATDGSGNLYVGGDFTFIGDVPANRIAKWDGTAWSAVGPGMNSSVNALAVSGTNLYAGGNFGWAGGVLVNYIAKWDGTAWSALGSGVSGTVNALAVSGTNLYAGGNFVTAGGVTLNYIGKWDGNDHPGPGFGDERQRFR